MMFNNYSINECYNHDDWLLGCSLPTPLPLGVNPTYYGIINDMCSPTIEKYGATPANIQWTIVRGDTGVLQFDFVEVDEVTPVDMEGWLFKATAYDPSGDVFDDLTVDVFVGYVVITAPVSITSNWGTKYKSVVAELPFDLQITIPGEVDTVWTPIVGTICVLGNVTPGGSL